MARKSGPIPPSMSSLPELLAGCERPLSEIALETLKPSTAPAWKPKPKSAKPENERKRVANKLRKHRQRDRAAAGLRCFAFIAKEEKVLRVLVAERVLDATLVDSPKHVEAALTRYFEMADELLSRQGG